MHNHPHPLSYKFYHAYANLPLGIRSEIVAVVNHEPMSWHVIKIELDNKTKMGYDALQQLIDLDIIS